MAAGKCYLRGFPGTQPDFGMPYRGQCLYVVIARRIRLATILAFAKNAVISIWPNECNGRKVHRLGAVCQSLR